MKIWEHNPRYNFWRGYVDLCTRTQFSRVIVEGKEKLPTDGAVMLGPNHCGALMDALLVLLLRPHEPIGFGARADIFRKPVVAKILRWLRIVPLARERDGIQEVAKDFEVIDEIVEALAHDLPFCLFSEGTHRAAPGMMPVKKGIFKIARQALESASRPVYVVPVGLEYQYFFHEMGRAAIRVGEPLELGRFIADRAEMPDAAIYRELCEELRQRDLALIDRWGERRHDRKLLRALLGVLLLPFFILLAAASFPIWLPAEIILSRIKDKAWTHTVYFALRLFLPLFWPFFAGFAPLANYYRNLYVDFKKY